MKNFFISIYFLYVLFFNTFVLADNSKIDEIEELKADYYICDYNVSDLENILSNKYGTTKYIIDEKLNYGSLRLKCNDILKKIIYLENPNIINSIQDNSFSNFKNDDFYFFYKYHINILKYSKNSEIKKISIKLLEDLIKKPDFIENYLFSEISFELSKIFSNDIDLLDTEKTIKYSNFALLNPENEKVKNNYLSYLGIIYDEGLILKRNKKKALKYFNSSTDTVNENSHKNLGRYYLLGLAGLKPNFEKAIKHYRMSKIYSKGDNQFIELDLLYSKKRVPKNIDELINWLESYTIQSKNPEGFLKLAIVSNDRKKISIETRINTFKWYYISSKYSSNYEERNLAKNKLSILEQKYLSYDQIEIAKSKASDWLKENWF